MPLVYHPRVVERAKHLYTVEGLSPARIIHTLRFEQDEGNLVGRDGSRLDVPEDRSTIHRWAKDGKWRPKWREARRRWLESRDPAEHFGVSGIVDPIWHLSRVLARRFLKEQLVENRYVRDRDLQSRALYHVYESLSPGPGVIRELEPFVREEIKKLRKEPIDALVGDRARRWSGPTLEGTLVQQDKEE